MRPTVHCGLVVAALLLAATSPISALKLGLAHKQLKLTRRAALLSTACAVTSSVACQADDNSIAGAKLYADRPPLPTPLAVNGKKNRELAIALVLPLVVYSKTLTPLNMSVNTSFLSILEHVHPWSSLDRLANSNRGRRDCLGQPTSMVLGRSHRALTLGISGLLAVRCVKRTVTRPRQIVLSMCGYPGYSMAIAELQRVLLLHC